MTKNLLVGFILLLMCSTTYGQNESYDNRLLSLYSHEQITELQDSDPDIIAFWEYYLDNGYMIKKYNPKIHQDIDKEVTISENLNLLELKIFPDEKVITKYVDRENEKVLIILPKEKLNVLFKNAEKNKND